MENLVAYVDIYDYLALYLYLMITLMGFSVMNRYASLIMVTLEHSLFDKSLCDRKEVNHPLVEFDRVEFYDFNLFF